MERGGETYYYHTNALGSVSAVTDSTGAVVERYSYTAYGQMTITDGQGNLLTNTAIGNLYGFTGRRYDEETGLWYYRNRYYNPVTGRFISRDPLGYITNINLYEYVRSNPINYLDSLGLQPRDVSVEKGEEWPYMKLPPDQRKFISEMLKLLEDFGYKEEARRIRDYLIQEKIVYVPYGLNDPETRGDKIRIPYNLLHAGDLNKRKRTNPLEYYSDMISNMRELIHEMVHVNQYVKRERPAWEKALEFLLKLRAEAEKYAKLLKLEDEKFKELMNERIKDYLRDARDKNIRIDTSKFAKKLKKYLPQEQ